MLAAELLACTRNGQIAGDLGDLNVKAAMTLSGVLGLDKNVPFLVNVGTTVAAKYIDAGAGVTDEMARTMALAMLLAAAADGRVDARENALMSVLAHTVPELRARNFGALVEAAKARVPFAAADFQAMPKFKNKTFVLACEIALCGDQTGRVVVPPILEQMQRWLGVPADIADGAIRTWGAKYALHLG